MASHRELKDTLYAQFARVGHALASPKRLELLDLLSQSDQTVEALAQASATPIKNTSAHLRVLRQARLVATTRTGTFVRYRLADPEVARLLRSLQDLSRRRLAEVEQAVSLYLDRRDEMEPVTPTELRRLLKEGAVTLIDVRPSEEFAAGHIPGALSLPVAELERRLAELPKRREIVAYCRGPYCVYSLEAVTLLRRRGFRARRLVEGVTDWRARGYGVATGAAGAER